MPEIHAPYFRPSLVTNADAAFADMPDGSSGVLRMIGGDWTAAEGLAEVFFPSLAGAGKYLYFWMSAFPAFPDCSNVTLANGGIFNIYQSTIVDGTIDFAGLPDGSAATDAFIRVYTCGATAIANVASLAAKIHTGVTIDLSGNSLDSDDVDAILQACVDSSKTGGTLDLSGQTPAAPPSAAGDANVVVLENPAGPNWSVSTD